MYRFWSDWKIIYGQNYTIRFSSVWEWYDTLYLLSSNTQTFFYEIARTREKSFHSSETDRFFFIFIFFNLVFFCHFTDRYIDRSWCLTGGDREGPVIGKWVSLHTQTVTQPPDWTPRPGESLLFSIYGWPKLMASSQPAIVTVPVASPWQPHNVSICKLGDLLITREGCKEPPLEGSDACFFLTVWSDLELSLPSVTPGCVTHYIIFYTS